LLSVTDLTDKIRHEFQRLTFRRTSALVLRECVVFLDRHERFRSAQYLLVFRHPHLLA